jgi:6-phosphogluconolactonase
MAQPRPGSAGEGLPWFGGRPSPAHHAPMGEKMDNQAGQRNAETGIVCVQTNEPDGNRLLAFGRSANGNLTSPGAYPTGGAGDGVPHMTSSGSVMVTDDATHVLVTNAGSGDLSVFAADGSALSPPQTVATGDAPKSVAEHDDLVYVLNTGTPALSGFRLGDLGVEPIADSMRMPAADADPAQVGISPDGTMLVITERGTNVIAYYPIDDAGYLGEPHLQPSSGATPYGFAFTNDGALVVTEAFGAQKGKAAASSYVEHDGSLSPASRSIGNGRSEICWATISKDGRYAFTTNFGDGAVSRFALGADGTLMLDDPTAGTANVGHTGLRDESLTSDGRFLYAINADSQSIYGWSVGSQGALSPIGSWGGLPETVAGLAAS